MEPYYHNAEYGITLFKGDCLAVLPTLLEASVDAVVTDPPYGIWNNFGVHRSTKSGKSSGVRTMRFEWDTARDVPGALRLAFGLCRVTASAFVFTGFDSAEHTRDELRAADFTVKPACWVKKCPPPPGRGNWWPSGFELAFYGYRNSPPFYDSDVKRSNVFVYDSYRHGQHGKVGHPTQKPLRLIERIVRSIVSPSGLVLDPFLGSGTTAVACLRTGRQCVGIELEEKYCAIAVERIEREIAALKQPKQLELASWMRPAVYVSGALGFMRDKGHIR